MNGIINPVDISGQVEEIGASSVLSVSADFDINLSKVLSNYKSVLVCIFGGSDRNYIYGQTWFPVFDTCPFNSALDLFMRTGAATINGVVNIKPFNKNSTKMTFRAGNGVSTSQYLVIYGIK